jgi:hypothetical protein
MTAQQASRVLQDLLLARHALPESSLVKEMYSDARTAQWASLSR